MRKTDFSKMIKLSVIIVLIAAMALCMFSCGESNEETATPTDTGNVAVEQSVATNGSATDEDAKYTITVTVVDDKGESKDFEIKTGADNLADALLEEGLVEGENGEFGLYIKVVNGLRADYELDGAYWALSKDGETLMSGASDTAIADGEKYELTYSK